MNVNFNFIGTCVYPKADAKNPFVKKTTNSSGNEMLTLNMAIKASDTNMEYVSMMGSVMKTVKTKDLNGADIEFPWEDRFDEEIIKNIPFYKLYCVDLGEENGGRKQFVTQYDAIAYLRDNAKDCSMCVTGQMEKRWYKDKYYTKFKAQNFYVVDEDTTKRLSVTADIFFNKECVDKTEWKTQKIIAVDGYISQYIDKDVKNKYVPQRFIFDASKLDETNERHKAISDYLLSYIDIQKKTVHHILFTCLYKRGAAEIEFDASQLTKAQKQQIELGRKTLDDFKPKNGIRGEKVVEFKLVDPILTGDFVDGLIDTEMKMDEFEEEIFVPIDTSDEKVSDVVKSSTQETSEDVFDLFG